MNVRMIATLMVAGATMIGSVGCGGDGGCDELKSKLEACGATVTACEDDSAASCVAGKLDSTCSNLITASAECAE